MKDYTVKITYYNDFTDIEIPVKANSESEAIEKAELEFNDIPYEDCGLFLEIIDYEIVAAT